jgi:hypothetical protein
MNTKRDRRPKTRARRLRLHPLCVTCLALGETKATEEIDHVIPLEWAGQPVRDGGVELMRELGLIEPDETPTHYPLQLDVDSNTQGLCTAHNRAKRNKESYGHKIYGEDGWPLETVVVPLSDSEARVAANKAAFENGGLPVCDDCDARGVCQMNCGPAAGVDYWPNGYEEKWTK